MNKLTRVWVLRATRDLLLICAITVVVGEVVLRAMSYVMVVPLLYDNSYNRFRLAPGASKYGFPINSHGFSDVEFETKKAPGTYRILGIGDSFAFGVVPYENQYLTVLKDGLTRRGQTVEIINMGIPGVGPADYLSVLEREGLQLSPDMVLLSFFVGNDFTDNAPPRRTRISAILGSLYVSRLARAVFALTRASDAAPQFASAYDDNVPTFDDSAYLSIEAGRATVFTQSELTEKLFEAAREFLTQIKSLCDQRHISLVVLIIPDEMQVNEGLRRRLFVSG